MFKQDPTPTPNDRQCGAQKKAGGRCRSYAMADSPFCNFHDPDFPAREAQVKGGKAQKKWFHKDEIGSKIPEDSNLKIETPEDVRRMLEATINDVRHGRLEHDQAQMLAYLGNVALSAMRTDLQRPSDPRVMPEIKEIERSADSRAVGTDYPGSDEGETAETSN
jgi:hypothetical protein